MPRRVLSTSWDPNVLATRNLLIESIGCNVVTTRDRELFLQFLRDHPFDAVVIGDSIPHELRLNLAKTARAIRPDVPLIIFVRTDAEAQEVFGIANYIIQALDNPEQFLAALRSAVRNDKIAKAPRQKVRVSERKIAPASLPHKQR